jgi:hypothetical protein
MLKAIFHQPWRSGWLGQLLGCHSVAEEDLGRCWCQKQFKGMPHLQGARALIMTKEVIIDEKGDDITSKLMVIPFADDRPYIPKDSRNT